MDDVLNTLTTEKTAFWNEEQTITSMEVAEMVEKDHAKLLRDIRNYVAQIKEANSRLAEAKVGLSEFFVESTYEDSTGRTLPCFLVTRKGCEFIANKMTGVKGTIFTARFINKFHEMESLLIPKDYPSALRALADETERRQIVEQEKAKLQLELDRSKDWYSIKRVAALNDVPWQTFDWRKLKEAGLQLGYEVKKIFDANYGEVNTYHKDIWEKVYPEYEI